MAGINSTATTPEESRAEPELEYNLQPWGDMIYGTKEQLQSIGLGAGIPFLGEAGETRKKIKVVDPRGFTATIDRALTRRMKPSAQLSTFQGVTTRAGKRNGSHFILG